MTDPIPCEGLTALGMPGQGLSLNHPGSAVPSQPPAEKLCAQNAWRPVSAPVRTTAGRWRLCHGEPRRRARLAPIWGFGLIQSLGRSPLRLQMVVTFGGLTWARATGRWGRGETSWSETNRQLIPELTPHLPGRQTTGPAHPQGQPPRFLPLPRRLGQQSTFRHRRGCKDISRQLVAAQCTS